MINRDRGSVGSTVEGNSTSSALLASADSGISSSETIMNMAEPEEIEDTISIPVRNDIIYGLPAQINGTLLDKDYTIVDSRNFIIAELTPGNMEYDGTSQNIVNAWNFVEKSDRFLQNAVIPILKHAGVNMEGATIAGSPFKFACMDFVQTESVNNNYSDSFLQGVNNIASEVVGGYAYMTNQNWNDFGKLIKNNLDGISNGLGDAMEGIYANSGTQGLIEGVRKSVGDSTLGGLMTGYRLDLPKIWKNTTNEKTYTLKWQLSCPADNVNAIRDKIIIPYTIALCMSSPISDRSYLYKWPYVVRLKIPGFVHLPLAAITNLQIVKPGDGKTLTHTGKYLSITLQATVQSLYSTQFIVESGGEVPEAMLTVNDEIKTLVERLLAVN